MLIPVTTIDVIRTISIIINVKLDILSVDTIEQYVTENYLL